MSDQLRKLLSATLLLFVFLPACGDPPQASPDASSQPEPEPPTVATSAEYEWSVDEGIVYGKALSHAGDFHGETTEEVDLEGDLYVPEDDGEGRRPGLLIIHGGGFLFGSRTQEELVEFAEYFAARGWVVFSVDYRLLNDHGTQPTVWSEMAEETTSNSSRAELGKAMYPAVRDGKAAARWMQANAEEYRLAPDRIAVLGASAGAHIAVALATTEPEDFRDELDAEQDPTLTTTHLDESGEVAALVNLWGGADAVDGVSDAFGGPSRWDATDAPALIVHGTDDKIVPVANGKEIRDRYQSTGVAHSFVTIEGEGHGPWKATVDGQNLRQLAEGFLLEQMAVGPDAP